MPTVKLVNNKTFDCQSGQTLLEAAYAHGIALEHSCRTGRCGVCKAQMLDGTTKAIKAEESLCAEEQAVGFILTCCRTAVTDVSLDIEDLGEFGKIATRTLPCRIDSLSHLTDDVIEVTLRTPPASRLIYLPGQYIDVIGKDGLRRSYSIANAPRDDGKLTLQIRKVPGGMMSRYWFEEAQANDLLRLEGPLGTFFLRTSDASQLVLLATGTGIAPIRAMLEQLAAKPAMNTYRRIHVYWGGRTEKDLYWTPDYSVLPLCFVPVLSRSPDSTGAKGYVQDAVLADGIDLADAIIYACGSESMISSAMNKLIAAGLRRKNFYFDAFVSSN
ncbi:FAD-binding oxidoreductase [Comamonas jiangduensis]|uniref:FAD-binding oxidoreductase n=1 Tax=Comamonas jiangduensis TaxID=1194168 RepID=UPI001582C222|nr:FAD-binding oxidoreductase [Comamonas jiangduensis]